MKNLILFLILLCSFTWAIDEIEIIGNHAFSQDQLLNQMALPDSFQSESNIKKRYDMENAISSLTILYESQGYFNIKINHEFIELKPNNIWNIEIQEGRQFHFKPIEIKVPEQFKTLVQSINFSVKENSPYKNDLINDDFTKVNNLFLKNGYLHVKIQTQILLDTAQALVSPIFNITPNSQVLFGEIVIHNARARNQSDTTLRPGLSHSSYIKSLWQIEQGAPIQGETYDLFKRKLVSTGLFNTVRLSDTLTNPKSELSTIQLELIEKTPGELTNRLFYEDLLGFGIESQIRHRNALGEFHEFSAGGLLSFPRQRISLGYAHPLFLKYNIRFEDEISAKNERLPYTSDSRFDDSRQELTNSGQFIYKINSYFGLIGNTELRYAQSKILTTNDSLIKKDDYVKLRFEPSLDGRFLNDFINPTRGVKFKLAVGNGGTFIIKDRYTYFKLETVGYLPWIKNHLMSASAFDYGHFFQAGDEDDARPFYQGGFRTVRGYESRSIFPFLYQVNPKTKKYIKVGGTAPTFYRFSNDIRWTLTQKEGWFKGFQIVQFTDYAFVQDLNPETYTTDEGWAFGLGLRHQINPLTLRVDYTFKKDITHPFLVENFAWSRFSIDLSQAF